MQRNQIYCCQIFVKPKTMTMKGWLFIFGALILTTISSCKKTESIKNAGIVGKWQLKEVFDG